ncbi:MAG: hypothetical protein KME06_09920 [Kastovskya adunca ATA6-11-RM4]|jgi:hypothetical protein|nr:hypothetical protein [Kastovskya adunca ATA6-11-RM4]
MDKVSVEKNALLSYLSKVVKKSFQRNNLFREKLDKDEMIQHLVQLFDKFSLEELRTIDEEDLIERIDSILVLEATSGMLNDLTAEEMEIFDAAVEGR